MAAGQLERVDEDELVVPGPARVTDALIDAARDLFDNWRLIAANLLWAFGLIALLAALSLWLPAAVLLGLLGLPAAGISYMAARIVRGQPTDLGHLVSGMRRHGGAGLLLGFGSIVAASVLAANALFGIELGDFTGWPFIGFAFYGALALPMFLLAAWPLVVDPLRADQPLRRRLRLGAMVAIAQPGRVLALSALVAIALFASSLVPPLLLTVTIAYLSLVAARFALPAADRLEDRATVLPPPEEDRR